MKHRALACLLLYLPLAVLGCSAPNGNPPSGDGALPFREGVYSGDFCVLREGSLPRGWKVDATNPKGEIATWQAVQEKDRAAIGNVLAITKIPDTSGGHFNLCWTKGVQFLDGVLSVQVRADGGKQDQGGGLIWRAIDANNYYVARYNPLEHNLRLYVVKDGIRKQLADAGDIKIATGQWFRIVVLVIGEKIECQFDGRKLLEATDRTFTKAGGVGLWTKADAASSFGDFSVRKIGSLPD